MFRDLNKIQEGLGEKIGMLCFFMSTFVCSIITGMVNENKLFNNMSSQLLKTKNSDNKYLLSLFMFHIHIYISEVSIVELST